MLRGIVDIVTGATGCHACFIYFLEGERLILRATSPCYAHLVGRVEMGLDQGLTGWVARTRTPEFLRDKALEDPRMHYVPEFEEERFQSMVAVPVVAKGGNVIGVVVLHTEAPREFDGEVLNFLVHTASLVGGAIENAQLHRETQVRVEKLTGLAELSKVLAAVSEPGQLADRVTEGARRLLGADACHLYRLDPDADVLVLAASDPEDAPALGGEDETIALLLSLLRPARGSRRSPGVARALRRNPNDGTTPLVVPIASGEEPLGALCCLPPTSGDPFAVEDAELLEAIASQAALALKKADLIQRLATETLVKEMFDALAAGSMGVAQANASRARVDLDRPYVVLHVEAARPGVNRAVGWLDSAARLEAKLRRLHPRTAFDPRHDRLRMLVPLGATDESRLAKLREACAGIAEEDGLIVGMSEVDPGAGGAPTRVREAADAARLGRALTPHGGLTAYDQLGAYRYLVHVELADAPKDRYRQAVDQLLAYDRRHRTRLVETLERYLGHRGNVTASARALYVHPNTVRQRLGRIERITSLELADEDLLSLELALKLVRLQPAPQEA